MTYIWEPDEADAHNRGRGCIYAALLALVLWAAGLAVLTALLR